MADEQDNSTVLGISFGNSRTCVAYLDARNRPVVARNWEGNNTTPSVVHYDSKRDEYEVGQFAMDESILDPENTVQSVRNSLGMPSPDLSLGGEKHSFEDLASLILRKVVKEASDDMSRNHNGVVMTVPAYFDDTQRQATKKAAEMAGLNLLGLVPEPVAALAGAGLLNQDPQDVLVYDLGGTTFGVTVASIKGTDGSPEVEVVYQYYAELGGVDWDKVLVDLVMQKFCNEQDLDEDDFNNEDRQLLQIEEEKQKKALSSKSKVKIMIGAIELGARDRIAVTREEFDAATAGLLGITLDMTEKALKAAADKGCNVTKILLVGGSSRMPQVKEGLEQRFPQLKLKAGDPDEIMARGAALWAGWLQGSVAPILDCPVAPNPRSVSKPQTVPATKSNSACKQPSTGTSLTYAPETAENTSRGSAAESLPESAPNPPLAPKPAGINKVIITGTVDAATTDAAPSGTSTTYFDLLFEDCYFDKHLGRWVKEPSTLQCALADSAANRESRRVIWRSIGKKAAVVVEGYLHASVWEERDTGHRDYNAMLIAEKVTEL